MWVRCADSIRKHVVQIQDLNIVPGDEGVIITSDAQRLVDYGNRGGVRQPDDCTPVGQVPKNPIQSDGAMRPCWEEQRLVVQINGIRYQDYIY